MILKPLSDFLETGISADSLFQDTQESVNISSADAYSTIQENMLRQSLNKQAETQIAGICAGGGLELVSADVRPSADYSSLREIYITVKPAGASSRPFIYIEPPAGDESPEIKKLKNTLSEVYNMSPDNIHITETE